MTANYTYLSHKEFETHLFSDLAQAYGSTATNEFKNDALAKGGTSYQVESSELAMNDIIGVNFELFLSRDGELVGYSTTMDNTDYSLVTNVDGPIALPEGFKDNDRIQKLLGNDNASSTTPTLATANSIGQIHHALDIEAREATISAFGENGSDIGTVAPAPYTPLREMNEPVPQATGTPTSSFADTLNTGSLDNLIPPSTALASDFIAEQGIGKPFTEATNAQTATVSATSESVINTALTQAKGHDFMTADKNWLNENDIYARVEHTPQGFLKQTINDSSMSAELNENMEYGTLMDQHFTNNGFNKVVRLENGDTYDVLFSADSQPIGYVVSPANDLEATTIQIGSLDGLPDEVLQEEHVKGLVEHSGSLQDYVNGIENSYLNTGHDASTTASVHVQAQTLGA